MPTQTFSIVVSGDDKRSYRTGTAYPPTGAITHDSGQTIAHTERTFVSPNYTVLNSLFKWDTSSLDDTWTVTGAFFEAHLDYRESPDALSWSLDWRVFDGTDADYSLEPVQNAKAAALITDTTAGSVYTWALLNAAANVSKTGFTGLRSHVGAASGTSAAPTGYNAFNFASYDHATLVEPKLIVEYTDPPPAAPTGLTATVVTTSD